MKKATILKLNQALHFFYSLTFIVSFSLAFYYDLFKNNFKNDCIYSSGDALWQHDVAFIFILIVISIFFLILDTLFTPRSVWVIFKENCSKKNVSRAILFLFLLVFIVCAVLSFIWLLESIFSFKVYAMNTVERTVLRAERGLLRLPMLETVSHSRVCDSILTTQCDPSLISVRNPYLLRLPHHSLLQRYSELNGPQPGYIFLVADAVFWSRSNNLSAQHQGIWIEWLVLNNLLNCTPLWDTNGLLCTGNTSLKCYSETTKSICIGAIEQEMTLKYLEGWDKVSKPLWTPEGFLLGKKKFSPSMGEMYLFNMENRRPTSLFQIKMDIGFWSASKPKVEKLQNGNYTLYASMTRNALENYITNTRYKHP